jgi:Protein of unknown function (DUF5131)
MGYLTVVFLVRSPVRAVVFMIVQQRGLRLVAPSPEPCPCRTSFVARTWVVMALTRRHTCQVLTKRPKRLAVMLSDPGFAAEVAQHATDLIASRAWQRWQLDLGGQRLAGDSRRGNGSTTTRTGPAMTWSPPWPLPNVWVGTSIENDDYTWRADFLRQTPASTRFLSLEPLLGPLASLDLSGIEWVIAGGESRPPTVPSISPGSATSVIVVRRQCRFLLQAGRRADSEIRRPTARRPQLGLGARSGEGWVNPDLILVQRTFPATLGSFVDLTYCEHH